MQLTNFKKLFDDEIVKLKANSSSVPENHPIIRQFREAIWVFFFFLPFSSYFPIIKINIKIISFSFEVLVWVFVNYQDRLYLFILFYL